MAHDAPAVDDLAEHDVLLVQVRSGNSRDEELRAVGPRASVRHAQQKRLPMELFEVLVFEFLAVDALTAGAVALCEVTVIAISFAQFMSSRPLFLTLPVS